MSASKLIAWPVHDYTLALQGISMDLIVTKDFLKSVEITSPMLCSLLHSQGIQYGSSLGLEDCQAGIKVNLQNLHAKSITGIPKIAHCHASKDLSKL